MKVTATMKITGGSVKNLSEKQLQANAEARVLLLSRSPEGNEGDNQIGCFYDSSVDSPQLPLETESSSSSETGLRRKRKRRWVRNQDLQPSFPPFTLARKHRKRACSLKNISSSSMMKK